VYNKNLSTYLSITMPFLLSNFFEMEQNEYLRKNIGGGGSSLTRAFMHVVHNTEQLCPDRGQLLQRIVEILGTPITQYKKNIEILKCLKATKRLIALTP
jgi:hypothetical protein